jgi:hypothetical protein
MRPFSSGGGVGVVGGGGGVGGTFFSSLQARVAMNNRPRGSLWRMDAPFSKDSEKIKQIQSSPD